MIDDDVFSRLHGYYLEDLTEGILPLLYKLPEHSDAALEIED